MRKVFNKISYQNPKIKGRYEILILNKILFNSIEDEQMLKEIEKASKFKKFDLIYILGDTFANGYDKAKNKEILKGFLRGLKSTYGTYAVLGNNDNCPRELIKERKLFFKESNVSLTRDDGELINEDFALIGRKIQKRLEIRDLTGGFSVDTCCVVFDSTDINCVRSLDEECNLLVCGENTNKISHSEKDGMEIFKLPKLNNRGFLGKKLVFTELVIKNGK